MLRPEMQRRHVLSACGPTPTRRRAETTAGRLSPRQYEVLELLANGIPARQIAVQLGLAETTVRNHIRHLLLKLDCHSQLEAVAVAYQRDLLDRPGARASPSSSLGLDGHRTPKRSTVGA